MQQRRRCGVRAFDLQLALAGAPLICRNGAEARGFVSSPSPDDPKAVLLWRFEAWLHGHQWPFYCTAQGEVLTGEEARATSICFLTTRSNPMAKERDMTSLSAVQGLAEWMRKGSGALFVLVVRVDDLAIAADPLLKPEDTMHLVDDRKEEMHALLAKFRDEARAKAQKKLERGK